MKKTAISYDVIDKLHPNLLLLLQKVCVIEKMALPDLVDQILSNYKQEISLDIVTSLFCANYFAQSSTLQGHMAARHGEGQTSIKTIFENFDINKKRYDLSLYLPNDSMISEDLDIYPNSIKLKEA